MTTRRLSERALKTSAPADNTTQQKYQCTERYASQIWFQSIPTRPRVISLRSHENVSYLLISPVMTLTQERLQQVVVFVTAARSHCSL